jgi:hypothetical protein
MRAAGGYVARASEAFAELARAAHGAREIRQYYADDVCAWLRLNCAKGSNAAILPDGMDTLIAEVWAFLGERLRTAEADLTFSCLDLDISGTEVNCDALIGAHFTGGNVNFAHCHFGVAASFVNAQFAGGTIIFDNCSFTGTEDRGHSLFAGASFGEASVSFRGAEFRGGIVHFDDCTFADGEVIFDDLLLRDASLWYTRSEFSGCDVRFTRARFATGMVSFAGCRVTAGMLSFRESQLNVPVSFDSAVIAGGVLELDRAESADNLSLRGVEITGGSVTLNGLTISGGRICGDDLQVTGGRLSLDDMRILFGTLALGAASFLAGSVSLRGILLEFEGVLDLPWARYTAHSSIAKDQLFTGDRQHDFFVKTASYRPGVITDWGVFRPGPTSG